MGFNENLEDWAEFVSHHGGILKTTLKGTLIAGACYYGLIIFCQIVSSPQVYSGGWG